MAKLYITEFSGVGYEPGKATQAPIIPPLAEQTVTFTTSTASSTFNESTRLVRIVSDTECRIKFGSDPTATGSSMFMAAKAEAFFAVPGTSMKVAAYDGAS